MLKHKFIATFSGLLFLLFSFANNLLAQDATAKQFLDAVKENVLSESSWKFEFELEVRFPETEPETIKGSLFQDGDKFRANLQDQIVISDGRSVWTWLREFNEVQITDADGGVEEIFLSPAGIVQIYEKGEYEYQHSGRHSFRGKPHEFIEFKPAQPGTSEYVKINLLLDMDSKIPAAVTVIARNGTVYNLSIESHVRGGTIDPSLFRFVPDEFPGAEIEDLRLN